MAKKIKTGMPSSPNRDKRGGDDLSPRLPNHKELRNYMAQYEEAPSLSEVARAFHVRGDDRRELRHMMRELSGGGRAAQAAKKGLKRKEARSVIRTEGRADLPPVTVVEITGLNADGELLAIPADWNSPDRVPPQIIVQSSGEGKAPGIGERALVKMERQTAQLYYARVIRALPAQQTKKILGVVQKVNGGALIAPVSRKDQHSYFVVTQDLMDALDDELVEILPLPTKRPMGDIPAKVIHRIGQIGEANSASRIAVHRHEIPTEFLPESVRIAESAAPPTLDNRTDLRQIPLITIDGADARDFDDAVFAEPDTDPKNKDGWHLMVAIADVAHYVRSGSALDQDAYERGNSVYFPDMVVPMLPEALSNGLCSLKPEEDRYCLAVHLWIDANGNTLRHQFVRGLMRSHARTTYEQVQERWNAMSSPQAKPGHDQEKVIANLYGGYAALKRHIEARGPLDLNLPEHKVRFDKDGKVSEVYRVQRLDSHKLIEAYMIAANVAAAEELTQKRMGAIFRIHDAPDLAKLTTLKEMLKGSHYSFTATGNIEANMFNKLLRQAEERNEANTIHTAVLRSQMQAYYAPQNTGHFGLALRSYCHFTSPIRRYSDLIVHRALIAIHRWGEDGMTEEDLKKLPETGEHVSITERRAMQAEREAMERYLAIYMADHVGADFAGHISGVTSVGLFIELDDNGAQGFVPRGTLGDDFFTFDDRRMQLVGRRTKRAYRLGQPVRVLLDMADTLTGSLRFVLMEKGKPTSGRSSVRSSAERKKFRPKKRR